MRERIDEVGHKYGSLTVIEYTKDKNGRAAWLCQCDCGNTKIVRGSDLRKNRVVCCSRSCPYKTYDFIDETNNKYGYLTVLYRTNNNIYNQIQWHCKCDCGKEIDVLGTALRQNRVRSCGCQTKNLNAQAHSLDLTNQKFGYLIPIEIVGSSKEGNLWKCKCECGCQRTDVIVPSRRLISGNTMSCGKKNRSHGEIKISNILQEYNIDFKTEYSFNDLCSCASDKKLRFDFAIFKQNQLNCLIEFEGQQHFAPADFFGGEKQYKTLITNDKLKITYCQKYNIPLLIINYNDNIEEKLTQFLIERNIILSND